MVGECSVLKNGLFPGAGPDIGSVHGPGEVPCDNHGRLGSPYNKEPEYSNIRFGTPIKALESRMVRKTGCFQEKGRIYLGGAHGPGEVPYDKSFGPGSPFNTEPSLTNRHEKPGGRYRWCPQSRRGGTPCGIIDGSKDTP